MNDGQGNHGEKTAAILPSANVVLQPFIAKIGHNVEEIRVRALKNILFKLEHKLICTADLVQEHELLIRLLEWFNLSPPSLRKEVLGLLEKLSKHISAAQTLLSIGAVEFLSQLRQDIDPELYQDVDNVIHQLLSLPQTVSDRHEHWCLYRGHGGNVDHIATAVKMQLKGSVQEQRSTQTSTDRHDHQFKSVSCPAFSKTDRHLGVPPCQSVPQFGKPQGYFVEETEPATSQSSLVHSSINTARSQDTIHQDSSSLTFFQWLPLSSSDRHILTATDSRLQSRSPSLVAKSCEFLSDVLFKDFPAEIFLQRPSVFRSLLEALDTRGEVDNVCLPLCAVHCLRELCCHVRCRLMATSDPALFCPDQDCWKSSHVRPIATVPVEGKDNTSTQEQDQMQERESGDGGLGSGAGSSSSGIDQHALSATDEDEEDLVMEALQYNQLAVEEMCVMVLPRAIQVLIGQLSDNSQVVIATLELLFHVGELVKMVTPLDIWHEGSQANMVMAPSLISSFKSLGQVIAFHMQHSGYQGHVAMTTHNLPIHRMAVINVTVFAMQLLQSVVPLDKAIHVIPSELVTVLSLLSMDGILAQTHRYLHTSLLEYLLALDSSSHKAHVHASDICQSIHSTCRLLKATKGKHSSHTLPELINLVEASLASLAYHKHMDVIKEAVRLCSTCRTPQDTEPKVLQTCRRVILRLLSHYDVAIRLEVYTACLGVVKESMRISHVTHPLSTVCYGMLFLLESSVLYQMCCYGLHDSEKKVQNTAVELLENLLLGRLSMSSNLWRKLLESITPSLPFLEGYIATHPTLDQCILDLVVSQGPNAGPMTADGDVMTLSTIEQLRGALRLMLGPDPKIRSKALEAVVWHLMADRGNSWGQSLFRSRESESLRDLFVVDQLTSAMNSHAPVVHSSVERVEITRLWSIYSSRSMDWSIRKSAAEQLAIILQDPQWHANLLDLNAEEVTLDILKEILTRDGSTHTATAPCPSMELVTPCLKILRLLVEFSWSCRHRIAHRVSVYTTLVMATVVCQPCAQACYEAACLMVLLLFDDVASDQSEKSPGTSFSLPGFLVKSYQFPFNPHVHSPTSQHQFPVPQDPDPLKSDPAVSMLRLAWNLAWHESLDKLCAVEGVEESCLTGSHKQFWEGLCWRSLDSQILRCSHTKTWITDQLQTMERAASHYPARMAITRVRAHLITDLGVVARGTKLVVETLYVMRWQEAFQRYLQVLPNSVEDDELLTEVLTVMSSILTSPSPPPEPVVAWMARVTIQSEGPLLALMKTNALSETANESRRTLRKYLLSFLSTLVKSLHQCTTAWRFDGQKVFIGDLALAVALNLDLADNPQYYDLPVLESALECLGHVTARLHWSSYAKTMGAMVLCTRVLDSLVQVVSAFHAGRLGSSSSFMGKGVTFHASLCLAHLAREMELLDPSKSWASHWVRTRASNETTLSWLVTLWSDRSPEVRWMGFSIGTSLAGTEVGHAGLIQAVHGVDGGVMSVALTVLLNDAECGMVRQQSALLMCSLVRRLQGGGTSNHGRSQDGNKKGSLSGTTAITALLDHLQFHSKITDILTGPTASLQPYKATSSRACQSSASLSVSTINSGIPYKPLASSSQSASIASETAHNALQSPSPVSELNGVQSPGEQSTVTLSSGSVLSTNVSTVSVAQTQTPTSIVPLIKERGMPSGMSTTSSSTTTYAPSVAYSMMSSSNPMTSSLTPGLLSALAKLMQSLAVIVPGHTLAALKRRKTINGFWGHLDSSELQSFLQAQKETLSSPSSSCATVVVIREVLHMYACLVHMTHTLARADHTFLYELQQDGNTMYRIVALLAIDVSFAGDQLISHSHSLWFSVCHLLVTLIQKQGPVTVPSVTEDTLYKHWPFFTGVLKTVITSQTSPPALRMSLLKLLSLLISADGRRRSRKRMPPKRLSHLPLRSTRSLLEQLLDGEEESREHIRRDTQNGHDGTNGVEGALLGDHSGSELCGSLLQALDSTITRIAEGGRHEKDYINITLTALLAVSHAAKETALKAGITETTLEHIKHVHVQLNMDSLQLGKGSVWKTKENSLIEELVCALDLLRNFTYQNDEGKTACIQCGLIDVLHKLWAWCTVESTLRTAVLSLLCTLTARCPRASASVAGGSSTSRASQSGTTFLNSLLKSASSTNTKILCSSTCPDLDVHVGTHKSLFTLLANLVLSVECRTIIWKSNFLQQFSTLKPLKASQGRPKHVQRVVGAAWLAVLVNLSFFTDGQQMLMKVPGCVGVLLEFCNVTQGKHVTSDVALLVLRNLCFHGNSKTVLLSNDQLLRHLISHVDHTCDYMKALAMSALCSLVNNCQKARVTLKNAGLTKKLEELRLKSGQEPMMGDKYQQIYTRGLVVLNSHLTS